MGAQVIKGCNSFFPILIQLLCNGVGHMNSTIVNLGYDQITCIGHVRRSPKEKFDHPLLNPLR